MALAQGDDMIQEEDKAPPEQQLLEQQWITNLSGVVLQP